MNKKNLSRLILFICFIFIVCGCAKTDTEQYFSYPTKKVILSNGLSVINRTIKESKLVCIEILVKVGSSTEDEFLGNGMSHFTEHMLFKSNEIYKPGEIHKLARKWGGFINGYTGKDYTHYKITVLEEYLPEALKLMKNMLLKADFKKTLVNKERNVILNEIKMKQDEPGYVSSRLLFDSLYENHPYRMPVLGYQEKVEDVTTADLEKFYNEKYVLSNMIMSVVGPGDFKTTMELIKNIFDSSEDKKQIYLSDKFVDEIHKSLTSHMKIKFYPTDLSYFNVSFEGISIENKDLYALDILAAILGSGGSSRLNKSLNIEKGLVRWIGAYNYTPRHKGFFNIYGSADVNKVEASVKEIFIELDRIKKGDIGKSEIKKAVNNVKSAQVFGLETIQSQATSLVINEFLTKDYDFDRKYIDRIEKIDKDDVVNVARKYLKFDKFNLTMLLPEDKNVKVAGDLLKKDYMQGDYLEGSIFDFNVNSWKDLFSKKTVEVVEKSKTSTKKFKLSNGITFLVKKNSGLPIVDLRCVFKGGVRAENSYNNGISKLTSNMLLGGTSDLSKFDILNKIEKLGGGIGADSGYNTFGIGLSVLKEDLDVAIEMLSDILNDSNFPEKIFTIEKNRQKQAVKSQRDNIFSLGLKNLRLALFDKHPYKFVPVGTIQSLENIKRSDVVDFYNRYVNPNNMVLTIVGDVDVKEVHEKIIKKLGSWRINTDYSPISVANQEEFSGVKEKIVYTDKYQKLLMYGFRGIEITNEDRFPLRVLTRILSGGGSRLWQEIREKQGLSYSLGAYFIPGIEPGYFSIYVQTKSENLEEIDKLIRKQVNIIKNGKFSLDEIKIAKNEIIGNHLSGLQSNSGLAYQMSLDEIYGLGFDSFKSFDAKINKVTKKDIIKAANKYIDLNKFVIIKILPKIGKSQEGVLE